ncbi:helix-turn-helix domain-containing protein [Nonomuraea sp. NPDC050536]|uniref:helix-turn-helix domain-containing protein n=1 Tax=Nonomuraea sp. NPDC050536 TaxID=3364366 RepID=UPI0037CC6D24
MRPTANDRADTAVWDVASPRRLGRVAGVTMAGFGVPDVGAIRMIPHPGVTLVLEFGATRPVLDDAAGRRQRGSLVAGVGFGYGGAVRASGENVECVQVRLSPLITRAILGVCPADLDGTMVSLDDLWGREASRIGEQLSEISSWEDRFALTEALLARRRRAGSFVDREVAWAWHRIVVSRGLVRVDQLASEVGWSRKRLWSRFQSQLGLPPKRAAMLVRFDHAVHRLVAGHDPAGVAVESGYTDQSHLHRDVVAYSGVTPANVAGEPFLTIDDVAWPNRGTPLAAAGVE